MNVLILFFKKTYRVSARKLSIYNFVWGLLKATKKVYLKPQKWKKTMIHLGSIRQSLQAQLQNIKKLSKHQVNNKKISNKSIFSTSKVKRRQKFVCGLPDGVFRLNPKSLKNIRTPSNQSGRTFFQKKVYLVP
jgi:hypothetical protein